MRALSIRPFFAVCLSFVSVLAASQPTAKPIGFGVEVNTDGFFSKTVAKVVVTQVSPDSQALAAGVVAGDELIKVQDVQVPGNSATVLKPHLEFLPGVPKKLVFRRSNGSEYEAVFTRSLSK